MKELYLITLISLICIFFRDNKGHVHSLTLETTQILRGIACILIIFGHCTALNRGSFLSNLNVGWYCVAIFMFISGWGVAYSFQHKRNYMSQFWKTRFVKICIPFLSMHLIYMVVKYVLGVRYTIADILMSFLGQCTVVDNSWYPVAVFILYAVLWISFKVSRNDAKRSIILASLVVGVTIAESWILGPTKDWWYISNFAFAAGALVQIFDDKFLKIRKYLIISALGFLIAYCMIPFYNQLTGRYSPLIYVIASNLRSGFLTLFIVSVAIYFCPHCKLLEKIGNISYEIYLIHGLFIFIFSHYFSHTLIIFFITLTSSLIFSSILHRFHSKMIHLFLS